VRRNNCVSGLAADTKTDTSCVVYCTRDETKNKGIPVVIVRR